MHTMRLNYDVQDLILKCSFQQDYGSPLVCEVDGRYELVGVATYLGSLFCDVFPLSPYSRVSYFREWIRMNSGI